MEWPETAKRSIEMILEDVKPTIPINFFFGEKDWLQPKGALRLEARFKNIKVHTVKDAGHQLTFDDSEHISN